MDVDPERALQKRRRDERPYAQNDDVSIGARSGSAGRSGWRTGMPSRCRDLGGRRAILASPRAASGRVSTSSISWFAASRRRTSAPKGAVAATARRISRGPAAAQRPERAPPALAVRPIEDQNAVEVVELVLHDTRPDPSKLHRHRRPQDPAPVASRRRALDGDADALERQATLLGRLGRRIRASTIRGLAIARAAVVVRARRRRDGAGSPS